jgi:hypothetical protein
MGRHIYENPARPAHIQPAWLTPQFRHNLDGERGHDYSTREGQQQVFRASPGIRDSVRELIGQRMDALARKFHETHDMTVKDELERLPQPILGGLMRRTHRNLEALFSPQLKLSARKFGELTPLKRLAVSQRRGLVS